VFRIDNHAITLKNEALELDERIALHGKFEHENFSLSSSFTQKRFDLHLWTEYEFYNDLKLGLEINSETLSENDLIYDSLYILPISIKDNSILFFSRLRLNSFTFEPQFTIYRYNFKTFNFNDEMIKDSVYSDFDINSDYAYSGRVSYESEIGTLRSKIEKRLFIISGELENRNVDFLEVSKSHVYDLKISSLYEYSDFKFGFNYATMSIDSLNGEFDPKPIFPQALFLGNYYRYNFKNILLCSKSVMVEYSYANRYIGFKLGIRYIDYLFDAQLYYKEREYFAYPLPYYSYSANIEIDKLNIHQGLLSFEPAFECYVLDFVIALSASQLIPLSFESNKHSRSGSTSEKGSRTVDGGRTISASISYLFGK